MKLNISSVKKYGGPEVQNTLANQKTQMQTQRQIKKHKRKSENTNALQKTQTHRRAAWAIDVIYVDAS